MKLMRLAMCVAVFALVGGIVMSGDMDISALQAKLAAQEARLNDLQAKMNYSRGGGDAESVVSLRKNAVVSIGGQVNTRYFLYSGKYKPGNTANSDVKFKGADFKVSDAKINFKIDVNEYFDAFVRINLQNGGRSGAQQWGSGNDGVSTAQYAWVRWKNICNSGFGVLVGRGDLVFGSGNQGGLIATGWTGSNDWLPGNSSVDMYGRIGGLQRTGWDHSRTTQITPYWESQDGKFKAEVSFFSEIDHFDGGRYVTDTPTWNGDHFDIRTRNYGLDSMSARFTFKPIEGLRFVASAINRKYDYAGIKGDKKNNTAINLGADWIPCMLPKLKLFAQWTHDWNAGSWDDRKTDVVTAGFWYNITDQFRFVAQGDYYNARGGNQGRVRGWAVYPGIRYVLPYGVNFEVGYRFEQLKNRDTKEKLTLNTGYAQLGFDF